MATMSKGSPSAGSVIGVLLLAVLVGVVLANIRGGRDGCEASGGKPSGLECVRPQVSPSA